MPDSIGSTISHNWNAAVSFVNVLPSNMCDVLEIVRNVCLGDARSGPFRSIILPAIYVIMRRSFLAARCDRRSRDRVICVAEIESLEAVGKNERYLIITPSNSQARVRVLPRVV